MTSGNSPKAAPQESEESQLARLVAEYEQALKDGVPVKAAQRILQAQRATLSYRSHARK